MLTPCKQRIQVDDIVVGTRMTVFRNHFKIAPATGAAESNYLNGSVLQVQAISLPYLLVAVSDPLKGCFSVAVDVRDHVFMSITDAYAQAVISGCAGKNPE